MADTTLLNEQESLEDASHLSLRPSLLNEFIGQSAIKYNLQIAIDSAKKRQDSLDHILFYGPPGLGKTTLSNIIAREMQVGFKITSGPMLTKSGDLAAILTSLQPGDVLFIDEIHRLHISIEEILYSAMEDFAMDIIIGEGPGARTVRINLPRFTLIGATTRLGLLSNPLRDRFGIPLKLDFYTLLELTTVLARAAKLMHVNITHEALQRIAQSSRGTPRVALRLLKRVRDFFIVQDSVEVNLAIVEQVMKACDIDVVGLDILDRQYLSFIFNHYQGGPVGIDTIAAGLAEDKNTIEDTIEPFLIQIGFINKTPRGRMLTQEAISHMKRHA